MRIAIDHTLTFSPPGGTLQALLHLLLTPGNGPTQQVESWSVEAPGIGNAGRFTDAFGNMVHLVNQSRPEGQMVLKARGVVTTRDTHGVLGRPGGEPVPALYKRATALAKADPALVGALREIGGSRLDLLHALMARVGDTLGLAESSSQTQMQADGAQVQQQGANAPALLPADDYAHLFIGCARALEIPARFVCGYFAGGDDHEGGMHAWAEAYDEGLGWIGFDPKLQLCSTERHVRLCVGLDGESALPLRTVPLGAVEQEAVAGETAPPP
jgi:transglutaminase-like putative cysteine protease